MKTFVVNLARCPERRSHMLTELAKTSVECAFVAGVDGNDLDLTDTGLIDGTVVGVGTFRLGAAGCALSHLEIYRRAVDEDLDVVLVLEDDILLPSDLAELADDVSRHMEGSEVVLLNFHLPVQRRACKILKPGSIAVGGDRLLGEATLETLTSTGAYLITREACERMARSMLPVRRQPDVWRTFVALGLLGRVRCVVPMPVVNSLAFRSSIQYFQVGSRQERFRAWVSRVRLPVVWQLILLRRKYRYRWRLNHGRFELVDQFEIQGQARECDTLCTATSEAGKEGGGVGSSGHRDARRWA